MALVVLLRGVNVGGHRTFRPSVMAKTLSFDAVSIGAAGTFVIRKPVARMKIRAEISRRLPFDADVMICEGSEILQLASADPFAGQPSGPAILQFAGVMAKRKHLPAVPLIMPAAGAWSVKIIAVHNRIVLGVCRREMKAIAYLGQLEKIIGVPVTTRSWNTILTVARTLKGGATMAAEDDHGDRSARSI
jgi:uncharacterized protein (DUF1697 family)